MWKTIRVIHSYPEKNSISGEKIPSFVLKNIRTGEERKRKTENDRFGKNNLFHLSTDFTAL